MHDLKVTPAMASVIKLARSQRVPYSWITGYYKGLNFGRIADVMKGRLFPSVPPANGLPADFPRALAPQWRAAHWPPSFNTHSLHKPSAPVWTMRLSRLHDWMQIPIRFLSKFIVFLSASICWSVAHAAAICRDESGVSASLNILSTNPFKCPLGAA